ncbi:MAG: hypothetical protein ACRDRJ_41960 [Streptosporangiaceae bacterium]
MTGADVIVLAPWLAFGAGLAAIGGRLVAHHRARRLAEAGRRRRSTTARVGEDWPAVRPPGSGDMGGQPEREPVSGAERESLLPRPPRS